MIRTLPPALGVFLIHCALLTAQGLPTVVLRASPNPSKFGAPVQLTASVTPTTATGSITFYDGVTVLGAAPVVSGSAKLSTILLGGGRHSLTAFYAGDANNAPATSAPVAQIVNVARSNTFLNGASALAGSSPQGIVLGDFNNDGRADLAVADRNDNTTTVLIGKGDGTFATPVRLATITAPAFLVSGDVNRDGNADLIAASSAGSIQVLYGDGAGGFSAGAISSVFEAATISAIGIGDFNGDGIQDLALATLYPAQQVVIFLGSANGSFTPFSSAYVGSNPVALRVADFNNDGKADLALADSSDGTVRVLLGNGDGTFAPAVNFIAGSGLFALAVADFNGDGNTDIAVTAQKTNTVGVLLGDGHGRFTLQSNAPATGGTPEGIAASDFNGDGRPDLAVTNASDNTVSLLLGNGDGTFTASGVYSAGVNPFALAVGDLNGDSIADLVVLNVPGDTGALASSVSVLVGAAYPALHASGGDGQSTAVGTRFSMPLQIIVADLNGNAIPGALVNFTVPSSGPSASLTSSMVTTNSHGIANVTVTANGTPGTYLVAAMLQGTSLSPATFSLTNTVGAPYTITAKSGSGQRAPINSSFGGPLTVLVTDAYGNPVAGANVTFSANAAASGASAMPSAATVASDSTGLASFTPAANGIAGSYAIAATVSGVASSASFTLSNIPARPGFILSASGSPAQLGSNVTLTATLNPAGPTGRVTFYDGTAVLGSSSVSATGKASFSTSLLAAGKRSLSAYYSGDANYTGAKSPALLQVVNAVQATAFYPGNSVGVGNTPISIVMGDFNRDGAADLAVANTASGTVSVLLGNGDGTFATSVDYAAGTSPQAIVAGDFNNDGNTDLAIAGAGAVTILSGDGTGGFSPSTTISISQGSAIGLSVADFNSDGFADLAVLDAANGAVDIYLGGQNGTFSPGGSLAAVNPSALAAGDFNGDGYPDLAVISNGSVSIFLGGLEGFALAGNYGVGNGPLSVTVADFESRGVLDIAVANLSDGTVSVLPGNGDGTFQNQTAYATGGTPSFVATADADGDGILDLIVTNSKEGTIAVLYGKGDGTFGVAVPYQVGTFPTAVAAGEFNKDGRTDLAVANGGDAHVSILLGAGSPASFSSISGTPQSATVLATFATALQVKVVDANNNPVPGTTVSFSVPTSGASAVLSNTAAITGASGVASVTAIANKIAGAYRVTASIANVALPAVFALNNTIGPAGSITASAGTPQSAVVTTQFTTPLAVLVTDAGGNPVPNATVSFGAPTSGATAVLSNATAITNNAGMASITATANGATGTYNVSASVAGVVSPVLFALTNTAAPASPTITTSTLANGAVGSSYSEVLSALGGAGPYSWSLKAGSLPVGLTLGTAGTISGTPTVPAVSTFTIAVTDSAGQIATKVLSITVTPFISLSLPAGNPQPGSTVTGGQIQSAQAVTGPVSGTLSLSFNENAVALPNPYVNPGVCFDAAACSSAPQTTASFTIPAGSSSTPIPALQTGTVAGDIVISLDVPGQPTTTSTITIPRAAPVIEANSVQILDVTATGFMVELVANSSPRDVQTATFTFNPASGAKINGGATFTVDVSALLAQWYGSAQGQSYGSAFSLQVPFTLNGNASAVGSVTVTLTNSAGTSAPVTGTP